MQKVEQRMEQLPRGLGRGELYKRLSFLIPPHPTQCFRAILPGTLRALMRPNPLPADLSRWRGIVVLRADIDTKLRVLRALRG